MKYSRKNDIKFHTDNTSMEFCYNFTSKSSPRFFCNSRFSVINITGGPGFFRIFLRIFSYLDIVYQYNFIQNEKKRFFSLKCFIMKIFIMKIFSQ